MRVKLHLISMPWSNPELPSIQIAALKAYIDEVFSRQVATRTYSAFASIALKPGRAGYTNYCDRYEDFEEYPYFVMYCRDLLRQTPSLRRISISKLISQINESGSQERLTLRKVAQLEQRTRKYIDRRIVPQLSKRSLNVLGFTLNYFQLHASLYCARYLREKFPQFDYLLIFGGATVGYPKVAEVMQRMGVEGLCVIGEGERKLELVLREILRTPVEERAELQERLASLHHAIYDIQRRTVNLYESNPAQLLDLQIPVERLPTPDFREYYSSLRATFPDRTQHNGYKATSWLAMEGTRGCFAKCDFCDVHTSWSGFRKSGAERILDQALTLMRRHRSHRIKFMDNVCDTWAERYAELLIEKKFQITSFMECRVHHPEVFWTKLSLSGVQLVQVGIEALSPVLLRAMNKGTRAKQNLLVQKWLKELGIESLSNLISHHPKSTIADVRETKRILELIPHLDRLDFSDLSLQLGTPLDRRLSPDERRQLFERQAFSLPKSLDPYFVLKGEYEPPDEWFAKGVPAAWDELIEWEEEFFERLGENASMTATRCGPNEICVADGRSPTLEEHYLEGPMAQVYDLCHQGATFEVLCRDLNTSSHQIQLALQKLINRRLIVELEGFYIALALRPRDELIHNYIAHAQQSSSRIPAANATRVVRELAVLGLADASTRQVSV